MIKFSRSQRCHHIARLKIARKSYWGRNNPANQFISGLPSAMSPTDLGRVVQYAQPCSCSICGNQRRFGFIPLSEKRDQATLKEGLEAWGAKLEVF